MLISCNKLKTHIKNSNDIDWIKFGKNLPYVQLK